MTRALIVIDIQNDYFPDGALPLHQPEKAEQRILDAMTAAQQAGDRVILVRHVSPAERGLFSAEPGNEIRPAIRQAAPDAPVVVKQLADAFQDTDLADHLQGVDSLIVCGMMTQNCVLFTAMAAMTAGRDVTVAGDLCAAPGEAVHMIALSGLGSKLPVQMAAELWPGLAA